MKKGKLVFLVGHANWGKSMTLRALTKGNWRIKYTEIGGKRFFIRRMSNDDKGKEFLEFMQSLEVVRRPFVMAAFCPNFSEKKVRTELILENIKAKPYQVFFWVIEHAFEGDRVITNEEIKALKKYGKVETFSVKAKAEIRAKAFKKYITDVVLG